MMLHTERLNRWNLVVGQLSPLRVLHAALNRRDNMPVGYIFGGTRGVGKSSVARLFSSALMCTGNVPLGCGKCASCKFSISDLKDHPDYNEVVAAQVSGVQQARELITNLQGNAVVGQRKVVLIDEAHRLSPEAWDVYLEPLLAHSTETVFLFATNEPEQVPETIQSRCCKLLFTRITDKEITGILTARAEDSGMKVDHAALMAITTRAQGIPRDALRMLSTVAMLSPITIQSVNQMLPPDPALLAFNVFVGLMRKDVPAACRAIDLLEVQVNPRGAIEVMFSLYCKEIFSNESVIKQAFPDMGRMSRIFLQWLGPPSLPAEVLPGLLLELSEVCSGFSKEVPQNAAPVQPPAPKKSLDRPVMKLPVDPDSIVKAFGLKGTRT